MPSRNAVVGGLCGMGPLRDQLDGARPDTLVIFDTHWFTTVEHVFAGAPHFRGEYTSEELPSLIREYAYDFPGAPALAELLAEVGKERSVRLTNATSPNLPLHYPTLNLLDYLRKDERVLSIGVCQTAEAHNFIGLGEVLAEAISRSDARVALLAAGGMSHRFWPMDSLLEHGGWDAANVRIHLGTTTHHGRRHRRDLLRLDDARHQRPDHELPAVDHDEQQQLERQRDEDGRQHQHPH